MPLRDIDCVVLCGGKGTRARSYLGDTPKVLAPIKGRPFIEWHIDYLRQHGAKRIILLAGYGHGQVRDWLTDRPIPDVALVTDNKREGCGVALYDARDLLLSHYVLVTNGDTLLRGALSKVIPHLKTHAPCVLTVGGHSTGLCILPNHWVQAQSWFARPLEALFDFSFLDIGTPEGYAQAEAFVSQADMADREHSIA